MISLIPCYSLEDFSLYRQASDVDEIFSAWSALYHPALVAHFDEAPRWEAAGSPSTGQKRRLVVVPPCAEYLISHSWLKSAETEGAIVIRHTADRDEILKIAFEKLGISPYPEGVTSEEQPEYDDAANTFLSVGLGCLLEELLTRKLRYMSNLDQVSFKTRILEGARSYMARDTEEREKNLQKAFDLLTTSKEYFFPTATKFLDLTWIQEEEDLSEALPNALKSRSYRKEKTNLVFPVPLLQKCEKEYPQLLALLKEEIDAQRVMLIGGDRWEAPLYLMSPTEMGRMLVEGRNEYVRLLGVAPSVFGRQEAGYAQLLPQILKQTGYRGVLARTGDGWSLLEKPSDRSQIRWQGRDGSIVAAFCKKSLDATNSEDILQLPDRIGNSYYSDDASAIVFEHRPGNESRWLRDIMRMDRYSPVLGKFYDINDYFRVTEGSGDKEKFVKDRFKTNFLTRSAKRNREDLVSLWVKRQRLGAVSTVLDNLETTIRILTLKTKKSPALNALFSEYITRSNELKKKATDALTQIDDYLLPVESTCENLPFDVDALFDELEESKTQMGAAASNYLSQALGGTDDVNASKRPGSLFINTKSTPTELVWEVRALSGKTDPTIFDEVFAQAPNVKTRVFSSDSSNVVQYVAELSPGEAFWLPKIANYEYNFITRPLFDRDSAAPALFENANVQSSEPQESQVSKSKKTSLFKKVASKLVGDAPNLAQSSSTTDERANRTLAEYVFKRYSATEVEKYYRLKNDFFELRIDPTTGTVNRLTTFESTARFNNGVLRQPTLGNRLAWDLALKLPEDLLKDDRRPHEDPRYGYTVPAADSIEVLSSVPGIGRIKTTGRMMAPNGEIAGLFTQLVTIRLRSPIIEVELELEPRMTPDSAPWSSYFACRFAWKDSLAEIRGGVGASLIGTARDYIQAPECVDIHSDESIGITILSCGLPYYRKISDTRMDSILIPRGETKRRFHFAIGVDLADPHTAALDKLFPDPFKLDATPCPKRVATSFFSSDAFNVHILSTSPILSDPASVDSSLIGVKMTLLETHSAKTQATIRSFLPIERIELLNLIDETQKETIEPANANSIDLVFAPRQLKTLAVYFKDASLK